MVLYDAGSNFSSVSFENEYNANEKRVEISCTVSAFLDDGSGEKALRTNAVIDVLKHDG